MIHLVPWCATHKREHQQREHAVPCLVCGAPAIKFDGKCQEHSICKMTWASVEIARPMASSG